MNKEIIEQYAKEHMWVARLVWRHMMPWLGAIGTAGYVLIHAGWIDIPARAGEVKTLREDLVRNQVTITKQIDENQEAIGDIEEAVRDVKTDLEGTAKTLQAIKENQDKVLDYLLGNR